MYMQARWTDEVNYPKGSTHFNLFLRMEMCAFCQVKPLSIKINSLQKQWDDQNNLLLKLKGFPHNRKKTCPPPLKKWRTSCRLLPVYMKSELYKVNQKCIRTFRYELMRKEKESEDFSSYYSTTLPNAESPATVKIGFFFKRISNCNI